MSAIPISVAELEEFALELARLAGSIALANFRRNVDIKNKDAAGFDPVTAADHAIEQILRTTILERFPGHGIVGEEQGRTDSLSPYTWYVDPIDGTRAYMTGSPLWGTLVGLTVDSQPRFGLMVQPVLEEVFFGTPDSSWLIDANERRRLTARSCTKLAEAALASTHPDLFDDAAGAAFRALADRCLLHSWGGDCYNYAMLAAGCIDLVVEDQLKPFDIVPLIPILQGAGCVVTNWAGEPALGGGKVLAAATPELHAAAMEVLGS